MREGLGPSSGPCCWQLGAMTKQMPVAQRVGSVNLVFGFDLEFACYI